MALQSTGPISFADIRDEFGGSGAVSLGSYYAGGANVANDAFVIAGSYGNIPTGGAIDLQKFYGTRKGVNYSTPSTTFTVPAKVVKIQGFAVGGGGGGGYGGLNYGNAGGGGGGGGYSSSIFNVTPGQVISISIGQGGFNAGGYFNNGGNGGDSYAGPLSSPLVYAGGGGAGRGDTGGGYGGYGNVAYGSGGAGGGGFAPGGAAGSGHPLGGGYGIGGQGGGGGDAHGSSSGIYGYVRLRY